MLSLFRNNQFTTAIFLAIYVGLTHLAALTGYWPAPGEDVVDSGALYRMWFDWLGHHRLYSAISATVLVFIQALAVNMLADEFRLLGDRNWLPGLFYALVAVCLPDFLYLSPPLVAVTFIPMVLRRIFNTYKQPNATGLIFDAAFWTTVASLFYPPAIFLLAAVFAGINIMRAFNFRELLVLLTGVATPVFLAWLWYFWTDRGGEFWGIQFNGLFHRYQFDSSFNYFTIVESIMMGLLFLIVLLSYGTYSFRKLIQMQKYVGILYWFLFAAGLTLLLQSKAPPVHLLLLMPSMGIFLSMTFSSMKNKALAEVFHLLLLCYIVFIQFFPFTS